MNLKRGILIGLALYAATLIIGVIMLYFAKAFLDTPQNMPTAYWIITIITTVVLTSLAGLWYFSKAKRNTLEGLKLGLTFVVVGLILDLIFFFTQEGGAQIMKEYYSNISFYVILILVVATCVFIGSRVPQTAIKEEPKVKKKKGK